MDTTNKPVAWMYRIKDTDNRWELIFNKPLNDDKFFDTVPLYTHPSEHDLGIADAIGFERGYKAATVKELTDEEIKEVIRKHWNKEYGNRNMLTLCKAVLKEAKK